MIRLFELLQAGGQGAAKGGLIGLKAYWLSDYEAGQFLEEVFSINLIWPSMTFHAFTHLDNTEELFLVRTPSASLTGVALSSANCREGQRHAW